VLRSTLLLRRGLIDQRVREGRGDDHRDKKRGSFLKRGNALTANNRKKEEASHFASRKGKEPPLSFSSKTEARKDGRYRKIFCSTLHRGQGDQRKEVTGKVTRQEGEKYTFGSRGGKGLQMRKDLG